MIILAASPPLNKSSNGRKFRKSCKSGLIGSATGYIVHRYVYTSPYCKYKGHEHDETRNNIYVCEIIICLLLPLAGHQIDP